MLGKPPLEALLIEGIAPLLAEFPFFNASIIGDEIVEHLRYDIGFAVDGPEGLVVAVIRDAVELSGAELAAEVTRLGRRGPATVRSGSTSCAARHSPCRTSEPWAGGSAPRSSPTAPRRSFRSAALTPGRWFVTGPLSSASNFRSASPTTTASSTEPWDGPSLRR